MFLSLIYLCYSHVEYIYIYIYIHTHTHIYTHIYKCIYVFIVFETRNSIKDDLWYEVYSKEKMNNLERGDFVNRIFVNRDTIAQLLPARRIQQHMIV